MSLGLGLGLTSPAIRGTGAVAPYQQLVNLATADGWTALYDPTNPNTRTLRESGGGTFVVEIEDALGNLPALAQSTEANQPELSAGAFGEMDALSFNGSTMFMSTGALASPLSQPTFTIAVFKSGGANSRIVTHSGDASNVQSIFVKLGTLRLYAGEELDSTVDVSTNNAIGAGLFNGASSETYINSSANATGDAGLGSWGDIRIGARDNLTGFFDGLIGAVLVFDGDPGATKRTSMFDPIHNFTGIAKA